MPHDLRSLKRSVAHSIRTVLLGGGMRGSHQRRFAAAADAFSTLDLHRVFSIADDCCDHVAAARNSFGHVGWPTSDDPPVHPLEVPWPKSTLCLLLTALPSTT